MIRKVIVRILTIETAIIIRQSKTNMSRVFLSKNHKTSGEKSSIIKPRTLESFKR